MREGGGEGGRKGGRGRGREGEEGGGREGGRGDDIRLIKLVQCTHTGIIHNAHTHTDTHSLKAVMLSHMGTNLLI